jgi:hypothetical protein
MTWFFEPLEEGGEEHAFVRFTMTAPATPTTTTPAGPTTSLGGLGLPPAPAPTLALPTGSTNPEHGVLAQQCLDGSMVACDDLFVAVVNEDGSAVPGLEAYKTFADTCAGRQPEHTGELCDDVFTSTNSAPPAPPTPPQTPTPTPGALAPVPAGPTALQAIIAQCGPSVLADFHARGAADFDDPGHLAERAAQEGQTLDQFINEYTAGMFTPADTDSPAHIVVGNPWDGAEGAGDPPTEYGFVQGRMVDCLFASSSITDEARQNYESTDDGEAFWGGYRLRWFISDPNEEGEKFFIVGLEVTEAP